MYDWSTSEFGLIHKIIVRDINKLCASQLARVVSTDLLRRLIDLDIHQFTDDTDAFGLRAADAECGLERGPGVCCAAVKDAGGGGRVTRSREEHVLAHHSQRLE